MSTNTRKSVATNSNKPSPQIINIITRTSNRPVFFSECQQSIQIQTYPNELIRRYVTFDDEADLDGYIQKYNNLIVMEVEREKRKNQTHFPYHLYLNEVIKHLGENADGSSGGSGDNGWVMILDDDAQFSNSSSLEILAKAIADNGNDQNKFYIWKCQYDGRVVPSPQNFKKVPKPGDLHISCFAFHSSQYELVDFDAKRGSEFDIVSTLFNQLDCVWIDDVLTQALTSGNGTREDKKIGADSSSSASKMKISLKPKPVVNVSHDIVDDPDHDEYEDDEFDDVDEPNFEDTQTVDVDKSKDKLKFKTHEDDEIEEEEDVVNEEDQCHDSEEEMIKDEESPVIAVAETPIVAVKSQVQPSSSIPLSSSSIPLPASSVPMSSLVTIASSNVTDLKPNEAEIAEAFSGENSHLLIRLVNLLKTGKRIYIFDENNMKKLSKCVFDAITCIDLEEKLIKALEFNTLEQKTVELQDKLRNVKSGISNTLTSSGINDHHVSGDKIEKLLNSYKSNPSQSLSTKTLVPEKRPTLPTLTTEQVGQFMSKVYLLTDNDSTRNLQLERNRKIFAKFNQECDIIRCKDMGLYNYQNQVRELVKDAKKNGYHRILIINGNDMVNNKFGDLYSRQVSKIRGDSHLWFLGNNRETSPKEILATEFDLDDYLFLYDDITNAKLTTQDKAHLHWKTYGHREGRYAKIDITNGSTQTITNNNGFMISAEVYDHYIELVNKQTVRDCKNVLLELQSTLLDVKTIWCSRPDLIIPQFSNLNNHAKNSQVALKMGVYYNFYKS
jgi:hypothetical protein